MKIIALLTILTLLTACSNKAIYEGIQADNRTHCSRLPQGQYEDCVQRVEKSYEEYESEREEALSR